MNIESTIEFVAGGELYKLWIQKDDIRFEYPEDRALAGQIQAFVASHERQTSEIIGYIRQFKEIKAVFIKEGFFYVREFIA